MSARLSRVPEVVQTSAMDCGPACLAALLGGHGVQASYGRLREACQTDVDGTSIDAIEDAAVALGLQAEQTIVPPDHVVIPSANLMPAIAVIRQPDGSNHFVVVWRRRGNRVQVMDPGVGRRWMAVRALLDTLYIHVMDLPADMWAEWAHGDDLRDALADRLRAIGVSDAAARIDRACKDPGWEPIATLDAATRLATRLVEGRALARGSTAAQVIDSLVADSAGIPEDCWSVRATEDATLVRARGAVLVRVTGHEEVKPESAELRAALTDPEPTPWRHVWNAALAGGRAAPFAMLAAGIASAVMFVLQAALWRAVFDTAELSPLQVAGAMGALVAFLGVELLVEGALAAAVLQLGRRIEVGLRVAFISHISRLGLPYLKSRPISDLVERGHALHRLRELPWLGARILRVTLSTLVTGAALVWIAPHEWWLTIGLALAVVVPPFAAHSALTERELGMRTHHGALVRFYLDAFLGTVAARAHGVERAFRREHEGRLAEWVRAARREHALATAVSAFQTLLVLGFAVALVAAHGLTTERPASVLLIVYWTIGMAGQGAELAALVRELPMHRNSTLRLLEPLGQRPEEGAPEGSALPVDGSLVFDDVAVVAGGHTVLDGATLKIAAGEHVAIVGRSGAGKSTLLGLLLGWHRPARGTITFGGQPLDVTALRKRTAWLDPAIQLWNHTLAANLSFGITGKPDLGAAVVTAQLDTVLARLPEGLQTKLGEGGGLVSGGEGQRVRFGRAVLREGTSLVILDEPFRGLDRIRRRELLRAARERWKTSTILCATHDLTETQEFARVIVVDAGKIVEDGPPAELAARDGSLYASLIAEEAAATELWSRWRTVRVEGGRIGDVPRGAT